MLSVTDYKVQLVGMVAMAVLDCFYPSLRSGFDWQMHDTSGRVSLRIFFIAHLPPPSPKYILPDQKESDGT